MKTGVSSEEVSLSNQRTSQEDFLDRATFSQTLRNRPDSDTRGWEEWPSTPGELTI